MNISYTARDYDSYFEELKTKAQELFPDWTDFNESNVGVLFMELFAALADQNSYYLNRLVNELFLPTVQQRRNAVKILNRLNYTLGGRVAASVDLTFSFENGGTHTQDVTIPAGYTVETVDSEYKFETTNDLIIPAGSPNGIVSAKNNTTYEDSIETDGTINQEKTLVEPNFIEIESVEINSLAWTKVSDLLDSGPTDRHFKVEINDDINGVIVFGDGVNGLKPTGLGTVTYKAGGGIDANSIQANTITSLTDQIYDAVLAPVSMKVSNALSPSGGEDEESIDEARSKAPKQVRVQESTVGRDDYEGNAETVNGVSRALARGRQEDVAINYGEVYVYIVPEGGGIPSTALKNSVVNYLKTEKPIMMGSDVIAIDPVYKTITIEGTITRKEGFDSTDVKNAVDAALQDFFDYATLDDQNEHTVDFGYYKDTLYLSSIVDVIMSTQISGVNCVKNVTLTSPTNNTPIAEVEIPELATLVNLVVA